MSTQFDPNPSNESGAVGPAMAEHAHGENGNAQRDDSPELLRWRADVLMDEMMLGGVDMATGDVDPGPTDMPYPTTTEASYSAAGPQVVVGASIASGAAGPTDQRDLQLGNAAAASVVAAMGMHETEPAAGTPAAGSASLLRPPAAQMMVTNQAAVTAPSLGPIVRGAGSQIGRMAVAGAANRNVNLLPRTSPGNREALLHQLATLRQEVDTTLPVGHEWSGRASHLLDKADEILRDAPESTAEVEYYLQQVRSILDRTKESLVWSQTYYRRLRIYLWAWVLLSAVGIATYILYPVALGTWVADLLNLAGDHPVAINASTLLLTLYSGSLGGSVGALYNMRRHREIEHGFFDRKYSLRGLILPIIGAIFGIFLYLLFAVIYYFADVNPSIAFLAAAVPAVLAFTFGICQETVYGTRD